jgi:hypothetical protein
MPAIDVLPARSNSSALAPAALSRTGKQRRNRAPRRPGVSSYRFFVATVFVGIAAVDTLASGPLSQTLSIDVVGPISVVVWVLTLLGSLWVESSR